MNVRLRQEAGAAADPIPGDTHPFVSHLGVVVKVIVKATALYFLTFTFFMLGSQSYVVSGSSGVTGRDLMMLFVNFLFFLFYMVTIQT